MNTAIDLQTMITLEPEIIQEYYDSYKMSNYAHGWPTRVLG